MLNVGDRSEWSEPIGLVILLTVGHVCTFVYLFAHFRFPHVVVDNVKWDCRRDANDGSSQIVNGTIHRSRHVRLTDQVASSFGDPVLSDGRQAGIGRGPI